MITNIDFEPHITKYMEKKFLIDQNNKCARKPYTHIEGLMNYNCRLWKCKRNKGKFDGGNYNFVKIGGECMALCNSCYNVLLNRVQRSIDKIKKQKKIKVNELYRLNQSNSVKNHTNISNKSKRIRILKNKMLSQYKVIYSIVQIYSRPSYDAHTITTVFYGDILDVYDDRDNWITVVHNGIIGYVKKICSNHTMVQKIETIFTETKEDM